MIQHDQQLGHFTMWVAWIGMFASVGWLVWMWRRYPAE
jgi:hypothetical protein